MAAMRVLHAIWADHALCLWAEGERACAAADIADRLEPLTDLARKGTESELTLTLPKAAGRGVRLAPRPVAVLRFDPCTALPILATLDDGSAGRFGSYDDGNDQLSASVPYLAAVGRLAAALARRGRVLPVLVAEQSGYAARWRPVLAGTDAQRAHDLAEAMPPACRAAGVEDAAAVLGDALNALTDAAVRARLTEPLLPVTRGRATISQRYLQALTTTDAHVAAQTGRETAQAAELAAELAAWLDSARMPAGPVRTCFRLAEPADTDKDPWQVEFSLQSAEDPSLIVPAAEVWAGAAAQTIAGADPVEQLLAGLGAASRLFPELAAALREAAPCDLMLDTAGAFSFLKRTGPLLAGAGFGVLLPDWVRKARLGVKLTTRTKTSAASASAAKSSFGLNDIVDFR